MKKLFTMCSLLLISAALLLSGCGNQEANNGAKNNGAKNSTDLLTKIKEAGELRIGTEGTYPPFTFHGKNGELTGFDVEVAKEVAKRLGVKPVFMETQWDAMFAGLDAKRFDMIANQVGIRSDRQEKYDFSIPYTTSAAVLLIHKDNNNVKKFEDIKGLKSAQSMTSNFADLARSYGAEIVGVEGFNQAVELLSSKRVDVTINDRLSVLDYLKQKPNAPIKVVATHKDASQSGLMFRKGNDSLVEAVNQALQDMMKDGTYAKISEKWFGQDVSKLSK
ncbi:amino acid ABC transporter substrate-binding protein [Anoxybacillus rupiensis]|jgi:L-cystine transport system substrate-binding protein|uniref:Amino acid ABC transporter substrate-binding protein n=1 Tax=Anoxybacteroides rupiense TaxID=311460 RepID=A0ABT5W4E8_9BACL|nr:MULTISPECIES: amino acid ABC transporter substrate-binding protein [Anoxybacillus]MBB3907624.1 cystine transport system substrate-binding protein [Anoxybacillus rupiensis]MBS2771712.1 amino acid ABC transporter substrate-binding protein [Anoxybacillus rupiensis]MDE8564197.1 amino acid ABC transporter substrate-binding protein [Anoxybacillus rupiensis]QHC03137.1 transporter substrate-binding domain-containing protein [Anoxybacillus sp. PDR2]